MNDPLLKKLPLAQIYRSIHPWNSLNIFVDQIVKTIAYISPDKSLVAINKPYGVGTYTVHDLNQSKTNQDRLLSSVPNQSRYCISDVLGPLTEHFGSSQPFQVLKSIDRYSSGLVLITSDPDKHKLNLVRSQRTTKIDKRPPYGFRVITCGYPLIRGNRLTEKVGCELVETDDLGDHMEPIVSLNPGSSFKGKHRHKDLFRVEVTVKKIDKELSTSLLEVFVSKSRWDFVRCYISSKTSFILGDVRFSKRIREILGKRIQVSAYRSSFKFEDSYEPLGVEMRKVLGVSRNSSIPLMLDHHELRLKNYWPKGKGPDKDLIIRSPFVPLHFAATANKLNLLDALDPVSNTISVSDDRPEHIKSDTVA